MKRIAIRLGILSLIIVLMISSMLPATAADTTHDPIIVVSLGDSYSSGEGIEPFFGQEKPNAEKVLDDNWVAHRSKLSWPSMLEIPTGELDSTGKALTSGQMIQYHVDLDNGGVSLSPDYEWYFVAASGATTKNYWNDQNKIVNRYGIKRSAKLYPQSRVFSQIDGTVDYVTLTLGGNDVHFADVIKACATGVPYLDFNWGKKTLLDWLLDIISNLDAYIADIKKAYSEIMSAAPEAYIIVVGYPTLLSEDGYGVVIEKNEARLINMATQLFNAHIEHICDELGERVRFVDVANEFKGHEAYTEHAWINPIWLVPGQEDINEYKLNQYSVHPNDVGGSGLCRTC